MRATFGSARLPKDTLEPGDFCQNTLDQHREGLARLLLGNSHPIRKINGDAEI